MLLVHFQNHLLDRRGLFVKEWKNEMNYEQSDQEMYGQHWVPAQLLRQKHERYVNQDLMIFLKVWSRQLDAWYEI